MMVWWQHKNQMRCDFDNLQTHTLLQCPCVCANPVKITIKRRTIKISSVRPFLFSLIAKAEIVRTLIAFVLV